MPQSPSQPANNSYVNSDIPGVEDLILACADIRLNGDEEHSLNAQELSQDQTFASATDDTIADLAKDICNVTELVENDSASQEIAYSSLNYTQDIRDRPILILHSGNNSFAKTEELKERSVSPNRNNDLVSGPETCTFVPWNERKEQFHVGESNLNSTVCLLANERDESDGSDGSDVHGIENDVKRLLSPRTSSPVNHSNVAGTVSLQDLLKSPGQEIEDKSFSRTERISASPCTATNDGESCANLLNDIVVLRSQTPDVKDDSEPSTEPIGTDIVDTSADRS